MAKPEARLWDWLRGVLPLGQYSRIESETSPGFPDIHCQLGVINSCTLELKSAQNPNSRIPFPNEDHGMRRSQLIWIRENIEWGGIVWILAEVYPTIYVIPGAKVAKINGSTQAQLSRLSVLKLCRGDKREAAKLLEDLLKMEISL